MSHVIQGVKEKKERKKKGRGRKKIMHTNQGILEIKSIAFD